jgi:hypothetical protein
MLFPRKNKWLVTLEPLRAGDLVPGGGSDTLLTFEEGR